MKLYNSYTLKEEEFVQAVNFLSNRIDQMDL